jgi:hypothetical protein
VIVRAIVHVLGLDNASGAWYLLWSGFFGDITIIGGAFALYHRFNCHESRCWRLAKHTHDGSPYCTKHKPEITKENP